MTLEQAKLKDLRKFQAAYEKLLKKHPNVMVGVTSKEELIAYDITLDWSNRVHLINIAPVELKQQYLTASGVPVTL